MLVGDDLFVTNPERIREGILRKAANAVLEKGECSLETTDEDAYTVCEFVQPGQMAEAKDFALTVSGKMEKGTEKFGLFWDYSMPTVFSEEHALWLEPNEDGFFQFKLIANWQQGKAKLYSDDTSICDLSYESNGGLYFILKNAKVTFEHIQVKKGVSDEWS